MTDQKPAPPANGNLRAFADLIRKYQRAEATHQELLVRVDGTRAIANEFLADATLAVKDVDAVVVIDGVAWLCRPGSLMLLGPAVIAEPAEGGQS